MSFSLHRSSFALVLAAMLSSAVQAQSGGFTPGDIYLAVAGPQAPFPDGGSGIARIDPTNGNVSVLLDMPGNATPSAMGMAYDPFRDRILFGGIPATGSQLGLWAINAAGSYSLLHADNNAWPRMIAPAMSGRVYYEKFGTTNPFRYIDASNVEHTLFDAGGVNAFSPSWYQFVATMCYDAPINSLIVAMPGTAASICSGVNMNVLVVKSIPLSADGSHVIGPESCNQIQLSAIGSANHPCGMGRLPNGDILLAIDANATGVLPTFVRVDPATLSMSIFATVGSLVPPVNIPLKSGGYSTALGAAFDVDLSTHNLRLYTQGQSGSGTILNTSVPLAPTGNSSFAVMEISVGGCGTNALNFYCTPKTTSHGCVPSLSTNGGASASAGSGFTIHCAQVEANRNGLFLYSTGGANSLPFQGGTLCIASPVKRISAGNSGGSAACSGNYSLDFNQVIAGGSNPALVAGAHVFAQYWFRDPAGSFGIGLSAGVDFGICN